VSAGRVVQHDSGKTVHRPHEKMSTVTVTPQAHPARPDEAALLACLPAEWQVEGTVITTVAAGMSGAGVYLVERNGSRAVLKLTSSGDPADAWKRSVAIQRAAGAAGVAPSVLHTDSNRRAVVSTFVADQSFRAWYRNPATRAAALENLGRTIRTVHSLPVPEGMNTAAKGGLLNTVWTTLAPAGSASRIVPRFAYDAVQRLPPKRYQMTGAHSCSVITTRIRRTSCTTASAS
jgi:hypothetical protein